MLRTYDILSLLEFQVVHEKHNICGYVDGKVYFSVNAQITYIKTLTRFTPEFIESDTEG